MLSRAERANHAQLDRSDARTESHDIIQRPGSDRILAVRMLSQLDDEVLLSLAWCRVEVS